MGLLNHMRDFSEEDKKQGHRRVYTEERLQTDLEAGGLHIDELSTFFIKPLSNAQMEQLDTKVADALFAISRDLPGLGSMIYAKCRPMTEKEIAAGERLKRDMEKREER